MAVGPSYPRDSVTKYLKIHHFIFLKWSSERLPILQRGLRLSFAVVDLLHFVSESTKQNEIDVSLYLFRALLYGEFCVEIFKR